MLSFSAPMAFNSSDPDYACCEHEMRSGRTVKPKRSTFVAHKGKWGMEASLCRLSPSVVDLSHYRSDKKHRDSCSA